MLCFAPASYASDLTDNISVKGGVMVENADGSVTITYTREKILADGGGELLFKSGQATADVLAVGGGGGGGRNTSSYGGPGGGGAGGFVEVMGKVFKGSYTISVGKGGDGVPTKVQQQGGDGGDTTIEKDGVQVAGIAVAKGGGGGGAGGSSKTDAQLGHGRDGGSGGGGSAKQQSGTTMTPLPGGKGTSGQGNDGGDGDFRYVGGSGGGAGEPGLAPTSQTSPTPGGKGRQSQITGLWYAGGGAGGDTRSSGGAGKVSGGQGGGGSGGSGDNADSRDGAKNTGGGGGGGTNALPSGNGADGVLVIRLSGYMTGGIVPPASKAFDYDGTEQVIAEETAYYTLSGDVRKTVVGDYTLTVTLTVQGQEVGWDPDLHIVGDSTTVSWSIEPKDIEKPALTATSFTYLPGVEQQGYVESPDDYTLSAANKRTNAGTYWVTATLTDPANTKWSDKAAGVASRSDLSWTIDKLLVDKPAKTASKFVYTGEEQVGFVEKPEVYTFDEFNRQTNGGTYTPTVTLVDTVNTAWKTGEPDLSWTISPKEVDKPYAKTGLKYNTQEQTACDPTEAQKVWYTLSGEKQTNAGSYQFTATLNNPAGHVNYIWKNGDAQPYSVDWKIDPLTVVWPPAGAKTSYNYQKGTVNTPVSTSDWYDLVGIGSAENAGDYSCTATLKYNSPGQDNVKWSDGSTTAKTWDWKVLPQQVALPSPATLEFVYAEDPLHGAAVERTVLAIPDGALYHRSDGDALKQSVVGAYWFELALNDEANTVWKTLETSDPQRFDWKIVKATNELIGLKLLDWQYDGGRTGHLPTCEDVKYLPKPPPSGLGISYAWSTSQTGPWTTWQAATDRPVEAGTYYLRATVPGADDWTAIEVIKRFCIWTNPAEVFTDFVDIDLSGRPADDDKAVKLTLREPVGTPGAITGGLPGFEYARTGTKASEFRFVLTNAVKALDQLLTFETSPWTPGGTSTVWVKVPKLTGAVKSIRLYWHAKDGDPKSDNYPEDLGDKGSYEVLESAYTLVNREGTWVDYWTALPSITKTQWTVGETLPTTADITPGALKAGAIEWFVLTMPRGTTNETATVPTAAGTYVINFHRAAATDGRKYSLFGGERLVQYEVVKHTTFEDLGGTAGGRVLLGNNDTMAGHEITGQAYWQTDPQYGTYWWHDEATPIGLRNLGVGANHYLYETAETPRILWRLNDVRVGNHYVNSGASQDTKNYLPWSETCQPRTEETAAMSSKEVTYLILRNAEEAALYSPCYVNGIGTVYVDAVNGFTADTESSFLIEVATQTSEGKEPTDENCEKGDNPFYYLTHDRNGVELSPDEDYWHPVRPTVLIKEKGSSEFKVDPAQKPADLKKGLILPRITTGGTTEAFYRILAPTNYAKACRFRIRRVGRTSDDADLANLILLDNILVSLPACSASLTSPGQNDLDVGRTGKQTLGQAGALSTAFPAKTDEGVLGRAAIKYTTTPGVDCDTSDFVASARFNYRWRYLEQKASPWTTVYLDYTDMTGEDGQVISTVTPLDFTGRAGDIEWFYDLTLQAPAYKYVDYSGCGVEKPVMDFLEEIRSVTNRMPALVGRRQASGGSDYFVRLREGRSDWQGMQVVIESDDASAKAMAKEYDMELVDDNMWRAMVVVPTNVEGVCRFHFRGINLHRDGDPDHVEKEWEVFGAKNGGRAEVPNSGTVVEGALTPVEFEIDHAAGYLEFKMSDRFLTYQVGRAEYQDFNSWHDAHQYAPKFIVDSTDSNSVNVADMKTVRADLGTWKLFAATNSDWSETFYQADYAPTPGSDFDKEIFRANHETPNRWNAQNITFVSERLVGSDEQKTKSGMAGKLLGSGSGLIDFPGASGNTAPEGLEKVELRARLGQSYTFDAITYNKASSGDDNYMFFAPVTMSHRSKDDLSEEVADMAVGASASLIGYYSPDMGCYEFRVERLFKNLKGSANKPTVRLSVYKWYVEGFQWKSKWLCYRDFDNTALWSWEYNTASGSWNPEAQRKFYGMFISLETQYSDPDGLHPVSTKIVCGLSDRHPTDHTTPWEEFDNDVDQTTRAKYLGLVVTDTEEPYGWGSYGVCSKDCPAQFVMPAHVESPFRGSYAEKDNKLQTGANEGKEGGEGGKYFQNETFPLLGGGQEFVEDRYQLHNGRFWATIPGRCECFTNTASGWRNWIGLRTPTNLVQQLELYLKPTGASAGQWKLAGTKDISGYGLRNVPAYDLKRTGNWDLRLMTGEDLAVDVVVDDIRQYRWQAPDINDPGTIITYDRENEFIYSQALVVTNAAAKANWLTLQPARAKATRPVSVRSPILDGLGRLTFSYRDADAKAQLWVQVATNRVAGNLTGTGGYNDSIVSKEPGEQQEIGEWLTVAKYSCAATGENRLDDAPGVHSKTCYLGWHDHPDRPVKGVFRLFVPPAVVTAANVAATNAPSNVDWGAVTLTAVSCQDEPGVSDRSWRGWNMRTVGDSTDSEKRMNLVDMLIDEDGGMGLVAALNNGWTEVVNKKNEAVDGADPKYAPWKPAIYSPTMKPTKKDRGVGSVTVKARLYATDDRPSTDGAGQIVLWGARDSRATDWKVLCTNLVTSSVFSNYTWTAGKEVYTAVKFEVTGAAAKGKPAEVDRVIVDEITIGEKVPPTIDFVYARPFRMNLFSREPIGDILSPNEQPLSGESWGVQTKLTLQQLTDEIDVERGFEVHLSYFRGKEPWGYANWRTQPGAVDGIKLEQVGDRADLVFRSVGDTPESLVGPSAGGKTGEVVQFMLTVKYWDRGGKDDEMTLSSWQQPSWFYPLDYNAKNGGDADENKFSAYTVLDSVSPGRAWINEVSWNDGGSAMNGGTVPETNQYVEICVPASVDMSGWYLRVTDFEQNSRILAKLGDKTAGIPGSKAPTPNCTNGYEFLVLQSPKSTVPGADGRWYRTSLGANVKDGTLNYGNPYQFELVRPSGVVEQQVVIDGTNKWSVYGGFEIYDGTNLVRLLESDDMERYGRISPKRFFAGPDLARTEDGTKLASIGVVGGEDGEDVGKWPGGADTWQSGMTFTPGRLNVGQVIPEGWFLLPNGTNSWVYFSVADGHVRQKVGEETGEVILVVLPQGRTTNVVYTVDNWFEAAVTADGLPPAVGRGTFTYTLTPTGMVNVVAATRPQAELADVFGLTADNPYTPSVLRWLREEYPGADASDIRLARYKGLNNFDIAGWLSLTDMYWLNIPPVPVTPEERASNDGTNWWFRAGITRMAIDHPIVLREGGQDVTYVNKQVEVRMYASNACTQVAWAPQFLRGLDYSRSDDYAGSWTSVTFKVCGKLNLSTAEDYLPFRTFVFDAGSFTGPTAEKPFTSVIDILDPFKSSVGRNYGWDKHPDTSAYFIFRINTDFYPFSIEKLKADSTYKGQ